MTQTWVLSMDVTCICMYIHIWMTLTCYQNKATVITVILLNTEKKSI